MLLSGFIIPFVPASQIFKAVSLLRNFSQKDCAIFRHNNRPSLPAKMFCWLLVRLLDVVPEERLNFRLLGPVQFMFHSIIALTANTTRLTCLNSREMKSYTLMSILRLITENETASVSKLKVKTKGSKRPYKTRSNLLNKHFPLFLCAYCSSVPTIPLLFSVNETAISYPWTVDFPSYLWD